jgi:hypothetical protein
MKFYKKVALASIFVLNEDSKIFDNLIMDI